MAPLGAKVVPSDGTQRERSERREACAEGAGAPARPGSAGHSDASSSKPAAKPRVGAGAAGHSDDRRKPTSKLTPAAITEHFDRLWEVYPKATGYDGALRIYTELLLHNGVDPDFVLRAGKIYRAVKEADTRKRGEAIADKYTLGFSKWLRDGNYKDKPPKGMTIDQEGNVLSVAASELRGNDGVIGLIEIANEFIRHGYGADGKTWAFVAKKNEELAS